MLGSPFFGNSHVRPGVDPKRTSMPRYQDRIPSNLGELKVNLGGYQDPPKSPLTEPLWSLIGGIRGMIEGSWELKVNLSDYMGLGCRV